jgi:hypothetical protein
MLSKSGLDRLRDVAITTQPGIWNSSGGYTCEKKAWFGGHVPVFGDRSKAGFETERWQLRQNGACRLVLAYDWAGIN